MAGKKETPRQKMIGMMYLVLTALLALNVQREILDAFVTLNTGIEKTNTETESRVGALIGEFKFANHLDSAKTHHYWVAAQEIQKQSSKLNEWIDSLRVKIIAQTEKIPKEIADTLSVNQMKKLDKFDDATRLLIGNKEDASMGEARKLKEKIKQFQSNITNIIQQQKLVPLDLNFDLVSNNNALNWEINTFYDTPLAATVVILNKLKGDVSNMEYAALNHLYTQIDSEDIPVDTIVARIIPSKKIVVVGETYHADIFLGAYSTTLSPEMEITTTDHAPEPLPVKNGLGSYAITPTHPGTYNYQGKITLTDKQGVKKHFPFASSYTAVVPTAVISATAMNVLYKGVDNPISVSVPGIDDNNIQVFISGTGNKIEKINEGKYLVKLANNSPKDITIHVKAELNDGKIQIMGSLLFRAKNLPTPYAKLGKIKNNGKLKAFELENIRGIIAKYGEDFVFNLPIRVDKFKVCIIKHGQSPKYYTFNDNKLPKNIRAQFKKLHPSDQVLFEDIWATGKDGKSHELNGIIITIIN